MTANEIVLIHFALLEDFSFVPLWHYNLGHKRGVRSKVLAFVK